MTLRIDRMCNKRGTRLMLSGELRSTHLSELRLEIERATHPVTLDLEEVSVIDIDGVRFLNGYQAQGVHVMNCSPYIREWMHQEQRSLGEEK